MRVTLSNKARLILYHIAFFVYLFLKIHFVSKTFTPFGLGHKSKLLNYWIITVIHTSNWSQIHHQVLIFLFLVLSKRWNIQFDHFLEVSLLVVSLPCIIQVANNIVRWVIPMYMYLSLFILLCVFLCDIIITAHIFYFRSIIDINVLIFRRFN